MKRFELIINIECLPEFIEEAATKDPFYFWNEHLSEIKEKVPHPDMEELTNIVFIQYRLLPENERIIVHRNYEISYTIKVSSDTQKELSSYFHIFDAVLFYFGAKSIVKYEEIYLICEFCAEIIAHDQLNFGSEDFPICEICNEKIERSQNSIDN